MMSVLIVDDNPRFRANARRLLEAEGFEVVGEAPDGHDAIASAQTLQPDLVLLDIQLPDLDGFEVAARLAELRLRSKVVLTSTRGAAEYGSLVTDGPARAFIHKSELSRAALMDVLSA